MTSPTGGAAARPPHPRGPAARRPAPPRRRAGGWPARLAALAGATLAALALALPGAAPAAAHAYLAGTDPADGTVLPSGPARVTLTFTEGVDLGPGQLRVFGPDGARVDTGEPAHVGGQRRTAAVGLRPALGRGTYTVTWLVVSADSHPIRGAFTFSVGAPSVTAPVAAAPPRGDRVVGVLAGVARWTAFAGFALLVGVAGFVLVCWPGGAAVPAVRRLAVAGWGLLVAGTVGHGLLQGPYTAGLPLSGVLEGDLVAATAGTRLGRALMLRLGLLGLLGAVGGWLLARLGTATGYRRRVLGAAAAALAVALGATWGLADHASTGGLVPLAVPVAVAHLLAMGLWLGGLAVLALVALRRPEPAVLDAAVPKFSRLAFGCVVVLALTGAFQGWRQAGTVAALTGSAYGRVLLVKLGLVGFLVFLASISRQWVRTLATRRAAAGAATTGGRDARDAAGLRRTVTAETVVGTVTLAVTALLVATVPARGADARPAAPEPAELVNGAAEFRTGPGPGGTGSVTVFLDPGRVGLNVLRVTVWDDRNAPRAVPEVRATLSLPERQLGPLKVTLAPNGPGQYLAPAFAVPVPGQWKLAVAVRTSEVDETTVEFPLRVRG